jgi:hypothetical protein
VDVLPTVFGLLKISGLHQSWGRDLFRLNPADPGWAVIKPSGSGQIAAFIQGDLMLVESPLLSPKVYRYELNPYSAERIRPDSETLEKMSVSMRGYIKNAIGALTSRHAGVRSGDLPPAGTAPQ